MRTAILLFGALLLVACDKDKDRGRPSWTTTVTGGGINKAETQTTQAVREQMRRDQPQAASLIQDIVLSDDGSVLIISGTVPDEPTHEQLVRSAQTTPGVKRVQDDLRVRAK